MSLAASDDASAAPLRGDTARPALRRPVRPADAGPRAAGRDVLTNPASDRVSRVAGLARRNVRARYRRFLVEGPQGVREAVRYAADRVLDVFLTEAARDRHSGIWEEARAAGLYVHLASERVMAAMSADSQGVLAVVAMDEAAGPGALAAALSGAMLVVVLTEAQDPGNAGAIIRAADAAGADAVLEGPIAWLLGNEARGLPPEALSRADAVISIPVRGRAESLNVAAAAAVCLYATARAQR